MSCTRSTVCNLKSDGPKNDPLFLLIAFILWADSKVYITQTKHLLAYVIITVTWPHLQLVDFCELAL